MAWSSPCLPRIVLGVLLQTELSVSGSIGVPIGQRHHHLLKPWFLENVTGDGRLRHVAVGTSSRCGARNGSAWNTLVVVRNQNRARISHGQALTVAYQNSH
jgi:hypothetical protein